jgi:hypothetical protein
MDTPTENINDKPSGDIRHRAEIKETLDTLPKAQDIIDDKPKDENIEDEEIENEDNNDTENDKPPVEPVAPPVVPVVTPPVVPEPKPGDPDYKEKFKSSAQEAQILHSKNQSMMTKLSEAMSLPEPSEDDVKKGYPDWDMLTDFEKTMAKNDYNAKKQKEIIQQALLDNQKTEEWVNNVNGFIEDPNFAKTYPKIQGREEEFKRFCNKDSRVGVNMDDLARSFVFDVPNVPTSTNKSLFNTGSGSGEKPKQKEMTDEEVQTLRTTNQREYLRQVRTGKIKISI